MTSSPQPAAEPVLTDRERRDIVAGSLVALLLAALDQTIVSPALPTIGAALGDVDWLSWIVTAYFLASTAVTPLYGKLADLRGRRPTLYVAIGLFSLGSLLCALAPSMWLLILGRAVQGLGGGGLISLVQTIIGDVVPPHDRARYMVGISLVWAVASISGPLLGGVLTEHLHWSLIFWINLPLAAIATLTIRNAMRQLPEVRRPARLDILGSVLIVGASMALMLALTWGGVKMAWTSPAILGLFAVSAVFFGLFARHIGRVEEALIPLAILKNPVIATTTSCLFFTMGGYVGMSVYAPLYFETVHGLAPSHAGFGLLPLTIGTVVGANIAGRAMARIVRYRLFAQTSAGLALVAMGLLTLGAATLPFWAVEILFAVVGAGTGSLFPICTVAAQNAVDRRDLGVAMSTLAFVRSIGSVMSVAALGAILFASGFAGFGEVSQRAATLDPHAGAIFINVFGAALVGQIAGFVLLFFLEERPLRGHPVEAIVPD